MLPSYISEKYQKVSEKEKRALIMSAQSGDIDSRNRLIELSMPFVLRIVQRFINDAERMEDCISEGAIGVMDAIKLFDSSRKISWTTYARHHIANRIRRYLHADTLVRLPHHVYRWSNKWDSVEATLSHELGRAARPEDVRERLGLSQAQSESRYNAAKSRMTTTCQVEERTEIDARTDCPLDSLIEREQREQIHNALSKLSNTERDIVKRRHGFNGYDASTAYKLARQLRWTGKDKVFDVDKRANRKLRAMLEAAR